MAPIEHISKSPGSVEDVAARLAQWGKRGSWGLARVEFYSEFARQRVITYLRQTFAEADVPFREITLPQSKSASDLYRYLLECLESLPSGVVSVTGWAAAFSDDKSLENALRLLNFERENLSLPTLRQIWWLPPQVLATFVHAVPDLDSWFQTRLRLSETVRESFKSPVAALQHNPALGKRFDVPYPRNTYFTGRDDLLADLHASLTHDRSAALTQAIYGLGGVGKTQMAVEYAYRYADDYTNIFWVRAETEEDIRQGFVQIARTLGVLAEQDNTPERAVPVVKEWLQDPQHSGWLLIYDNADIPELLRPYKLQHPQGTTLLTSRRHNFGAFGISHSLNVNTWNAQDAVAFLRARVGRGTGNLPTSEQKSIAQLVDLLGGLPLALEQAGAYIAAQNMLFADYTGKYQKQAQRLLQEPRPEAGDHRDREANEYRPVWTTWNLNFRAVQSESEAAAEVLTFSAFLAPDAIPGELLLLGAAQIGTAVAAYVEQKGREWTTYDDLLEPLMRYSLIQKNAADRTYTMHRLVQQVQRDSLTLEQQREQTKRVVQALCAAYPGPEFKAWSRCERLLPHWRFGIDYIQRYVIASVEAATLLNQIGYYLSERGQYAEAEPLYVQALNIDHAALGEDHPGYATGLNNLAALYRAQGRYAEAEPLFRQTLDIQRKALPEGHPEIATSLNNLALLWESQGRVADAESLYEQALDILRQTFGAEHPYVMRMSQNISRLHDQISNNDNSKPPKNHIDAVQAKNGEHTLSTS